MAGIDESEDVMSSVAEVEIDSTDTEKRDHEKTERIIKLPITRIKHLIKMDPDVTLASQDAVIMIAKATELFIQDMAKESYTYTGQTKRKTVQKKDFDNAIDHLDEYAFLEGAIES